MSPAASTPGTRRRCAARAPPPSPGGVAIGAQVGYRDLAGFGRRFIDVEPAELTDDVLHQSGSLEAMARVAGSRVRYVKPHGALYSAIVSHEDQAAAVVEAVLLFNRSLPVLGLPGSAWLRLAASAGLATVSEAFADRAYTAAGSLVPRGQPGPCCTRPATSPRAASGWPFAGRSWRSTGASCRSAHSRSACTATRRARWPSRGRCATRCCLRRSASPPSP